MAGGAAWTRGATGAREEEKEGSGPRACEMEDRASGEW